MISANRGNTQGRSGLTKTLSIVATTLLGAAFLFAGRYEASAAAVSPLAGLASIENQTERSKPLPAGMRKKMKSGRLQRQQQRRVRQRAKVKQQQPRQLKSAIRKKKKIRTKAADISLAGNNSSSTKPSPVSSPETENEDSGGIIAEAGVAAGESTDGPNLTATPRTNENIGTQIGQQTNQPDHGGSPGHGQNDSGPNGSPDGYGNNDHTNHDNQNDKGYWRPSHDQADDRPNSGRPGYHVVCLGGRMINGRCGCGGGRAPRLAREAVFICANDDGTTNIPGTADSTQSATIQNAQSPNAGTPNQSNQQPPATTALPPFVPGEVLVVVNPETPEAVEGDIAQTYGLELAGRWPLAFIGTRLVLYRITDGRTVETVTAQLQGDTRISGPQPNYYYSAQVAPKSSSNHDAASQLQYALAKLDIGRAHDITTGSDVLVAVIDSEIDKTHPELSGVLEDQFDATSGVSAEDSDHGTAIAGIIGARGMLRGIAPDARLLGVSALIPVIDGNAAATTATLMRGLNWAIGKEADVINLSLAGPQDDLVEQGVTLATDQGSIVVAAAGNMGPDAPPVYPAAYEDVIAVTATDVNDRLYSAANHGIFIDIAAPGVDILTPSLGHAHLLKTGTSFATAHITGIIALLLERNPALGLDEIRRVLSGTAIDLGPDGDDEQFGAGNANAFAALTHLETDRSTDSDLHRLSRMLSSQ